MHQYIWLKASKKHGNHADKLCKIVRALYGLKSFGPAWRDMFSSFIKDVLGFKPTTMDSDVYTSKSIVTSDGSPY